jgi:transposase
MNKKNSKRVMQSLLHLWQLENNPNVKHVSERSISYEPAFKATALKENLQGKAPSQIFIEHGFDLEMIGVDKPKSCLKRWRKTFHTFGENGFYTDRRRKESAASELVFLPPYSSQLNLMEGLWKWLKESVINNVFFGSVQKITLAVRAFIREVSQVINHLCIKL